jgi:hypothetical protein
MEEITYKSIMLDRNAFNLFLMRDDIKSAIKSVEKIDTAGVQILLGLIKEHKIGLSDLSDRVQQEMKFLGVE